MLRQTGAGQVKVMWALQRVNNPLWGMRRTQTDLPRAQARGWWGEVGRPCPLPARTVPEQKDPPPRSVLNTFPRVKVHTYTHGTTLYTHGTTLPSQDSR